MSDTKAPSTPLSGVNPDQMDKMVKRQAVTPGGLLMDIVLTPALKPGPKSVSQPCSPAAPLGERLSAAEARRAAIDGLKAANLSERLAKVEAAKAKKDEQEAALKAKTKEEMEAKLGKTEEKRMAHMAEAKEKLGEHLARVERAQKDLEIQTEAARLSAEFALKAKMIKAEENKGEYMEEMLKKIKEHEAYVSKVRSNQEDRLKPYFAELEVNIKEKLSIAEKRREEVLGKVVEAAKAEEKKVSMVRQNKGKILKDQENTPPCGPESA